MVELQKYSEKRDRTLKSLSLRFNLKDLDVNQKAFAYHFVDPRG